jgi:drug/metabolite transporter (DMT)-like permease
MGSTVIWALFWILGVKDTMDPTLRLLLNFCCGAVYTGAWALLAGISLIPNGPGFLGAVYIGVFEMGVTFVLWMSALRLSRTTAQVSNLIYLAPFLSLFIIHFLVGEAIYASTLVGLGFILAGTVVQKFADAQGNSLKKSRPVLTRRTFVRIPCLFAAHVLALLCSCAPRKTRKIICPYP